MGDGKVRRIAVIVNGDTKKETIENHKEDVNRTGQLLKDNGWEMYVASTSKPEFATSMYVDGTSAGVQKLASELGKFMDDDDEFLVFLSGHGGTNCLGLKDDCVPFKGGPLGRLLSLPHDDRTVVMTQCYSGNWASIFSDSGTLFVSQGSKGELTYCGQFRPYFFAPDSEVPDMNGDGAISWQERYAHAVSKPQGTLTLFIPGIEYKDTGPSGKAKEAPPFDGKVQTVRKKEELDEILAKLRPGDVAFVELSTTWCPACREYEPQYETFARQAGGKALFISIPNGDEDRWKDISVGHFPAVLLMDSAGRKSEIEERYELMQNRWMLTGAQWSVPDYCLKKIREDSADFSRIDPRLKSDREFLIKAIDANALVTKLISSYLRSDRRFMAEAVTANPKSFEFAEGVAACDRDIALTAVTGDGKMFSFLVNSFKSEPEFMMAAVASDSSMIKFMPDSLKSDREFMMKMVSKDGKMLKYASTKLRNDREVVKAAVKQNEEAFRFASAELKNDRDYVLEIVKEKGEAIKYAGKKIKMDREVALAAVKSNAWALEHLPVIFKKDREIVIAAVEGYPMTIMFAHPSIRKMKDIALITLHHFHSYSCLEYFDRSLKKDEQVVLMAIWRDTYAMDDADPSLKGNKEFVLKAVKRKGMALEYVDKSLRDNKDVVMAAVQNDGKAVQFASKRLQEDREVAEMAVMQNRDAYELLPGLIQANFEIFRLWYDRGGRK